MTLTPIDPATWSADVVLADGEVARIRSLRPTENSALFEFLDGFSDEALRSRFLATWRPKSADDVGDLLDLDGVDRVALAAEIDSTIVAVGRYGRNDDKVSAEVAFEVNENHHGRGLATLLLEHLAEIARSHDISRFTATTFGDNRKMIGVFRDAGYGMAKRFDGGLLDIEFDITGDDGGAAHRREHRAESASMARVLRPRCIAVVGASRTPTSIGHLVFRNIIDGRFAGTVYPVHPTATSVAGVRAYPSVADIPDEVDLVVVVVPAGGVLDVLEDAGGAGASAAVIITAGFAETDESGSDAQAELLDVARRHGMRIIGPNCIGMINTDPDVSVNATFAPVAPLAGSVGFASQSGALGLAILDAARELGLGLSSFVSLGNKADVSGNDLIQFWEDDPGTQIGLMYLESFGNPRKFSRLARRFARTKPLVVVKSGRTDAGQRAASSHTAALASSDVLADTLFRQAGITRVDTLEEMFDVARVLTRQPLPRGRRVAIVGNSGGPGILAADACVGAGLEVPEFSEATQAALREVLTPGAGVSNPVDVIASGTPAQYEAALNIVADDDDVDAIVVIYTDVTVTEPVDIADAVARVVSRGIDKPVVASFLSGEVTTTIPAHLDDGTDRGVPVYPFPEAPARALGYMARRADWLDQPDGVVPVLDDVDRERARSVAATILEGATGPVWAEPDQIDDLLGAVGLHLVPTTTVHSAEEAATVAADFARPVAIKLVSDTIQHKTDVGGVVLDVDPDAAAAAYQTMHDALGEDMQGAVVQPMVGEGVEVIIGALNDPTFGPTIMFGLGGTAAELLADRAFGLVPVTDVDADRLLRAPRTSPLLFGHRGSEPVDTDALGEVLIRLGILADTVPQLSELDFNPVIARPDGAFIVDARIRLDPTAPSVRREIRRL